MLHSFHRSYQANLYHKLCLKCFDRLIWKLIFSFSKVFDIFLETYQDSLVSLRSDWLVYMKSSITYLLFS